MRVSPHFRKNSGEKRSLLKIKILSSAFFNILAKLAIEKEQRMRILYLK
jgi:hypothetical protein